MIVQIWDSIMMKENEPELNESNFDPAADYYYSPEGYIVFTEKYHLKRGHCCQSGCKHCPYGFDKKTGKFKK
jgi:hypothetical protein